MVWKIVRRPLWAAFNAVSTTDLLLRRGRYRYIFILGHMRSGSTLLSHILASNPDCASAGEMHLFYQTPNDLPTLALRTCQKLHRPILWKKYFVDQINHRYVSDDVLRSRDVYKCVILLREPNATLKSMMSLSIWEEKQALQIYINRLKELSHYGLLLGERAHLVEYGDLVDRTEQVLSDLTIFLGLSQPLRPNYAIHRMTGRVAGFGDPSVNIKAGRIVRTATHNVAIGESTLSSAMHAYRTYREKLQSVTIHREADLHANTP